jgi:hypothetical protein
MNDTPTEILNIQREIFSKKTIRERFLIGAETIDFGRELVISNIKKNNPGISEIDLKIAVLKRYYENSFSIEEMNAIIQSITEWYHKNESK